MRQYSPFLFLILILGSCQEKPKLHLETISQKEKEKQFFNHWFRDFKKPSPKDTVIWLGHSDTATAINGRIWKDFNNCATSNSVMKNSWFQDTLTKDLTYLSGLYKIESGIPAGVEQWSHYKDSTTKDSIMISVQIWANDKDGNMVPFKQGMSIPPAPGERNYYYYNGKEWSDSRHFWTRDKIMIYEFKDKEGAFYTVDRISLSSKDLWSLLEFVGDGVYFSCPGTTSEGDNDFVSFQVSMTGRAMSEHGIVELRGTLPQLKKRIEQFFHPVNAKKI